jgi:hypothetical protein
MYKCSPSSLTGGHVKEAGGSAVPTLAVALVHRVLGWGAEHVRRRYKPAYKKV